jgi:hypothetical protein
LVLHNKFITEMEKLRMSPAEILKMVEIKPIEMECLDRVFNYLSTSPLTLPANLFLVSKGRV